MCSLHVHWQPLLLLLFRPACELVLPLDTLSWPQNLSQKRMWGVAPLTAGHHQKRKASATKTGLHFSFKCNTPPPTLFGVSFPSCPCCLSPIFECLTCHLPASECRHATRPAAKICKLDIRNALMKIPPAA